MIGRTHAKKEISRLAATHFYPRAPQALSELIDALQLGSKSNEHATLVISEALQTSAHCPTPADLKTLCAEVGRQSEGFPDSCDRCRLPRGENGNWRRVKAKYRTGDCRIIDSETSTRCSCARGRLLSDRENAELRAEGKPELRMLPGTFIVDQQDADIAALHGLRMWEER